MHCMLDLETFDIAPTSLIWQIGAVAFDEDGIHKEFQCIIKIDDFMMQNFSISASTFNWWLQQTEAIKMMANANQSLDDALYKFETFYDSIDGHELWGNGSDFDNVILANAYKVRGFNLPWSYGLNRCFRTIKNSHPKINIPFIGTRHSALDDARYQAEYLIKLNRYSNLNML